MGSSIGVENIRVRRGDFVLNDVSLDIHDNEMFAILGQTGSGKTVFLESIAGAYELDAGRILIDGVDASTIPVQKRKMGIMYQNYELFPHLTILENVAYGLRRHGMKKAAAHEKGLELIERFGIGSIANRYPGVISGGESQRAALARALVLRPKILLLDEPFSALDPATKERMYETVREVHRDFDCTIVFVTHDFNEARTLADRIGIILGGRLREVVAADELFERSYDSDIEAFLGRRA